MPLRSIRAGRSCSAERTNADEWLPIGKVDYQVSQKQSLFGRFELARLDTPSDYDGRTVISIANPNFYRRMKSFVLGDTYSISPTMVSSFRGEILRTTNVKTFPDFFTWGDLGVKNYYYPANYPKMLLLTLTGSLNLFTAQATPGITNSTVYQLSEDLTNARGAHQIGFGVNWTHQMMNYTASTNAPGTFNFTGVNTGTALSDLMTGRANSFTQSRITNEYFRQNYFGLYVQDTWKATSHFTLNGGVRWEPYRSPYDAAGKGAFFDKARFDQGVVSTIYPKAPAGIYFQGEGGVPDTNAWQANNWKRFAPRLGLAWDPKGDGMTVIRAAYGIFFDYPHFQGIGGIRNTPPRGGLIQVPNPVGGFDDPWRGYPGGNPLPFAIGPDVAFPLGGTYTVIPQDAKTSYINQWNLSIQKQIGSDWLVAGNYIGNSVVHQMYEHEANPAVYLPGDCVVAGRTGPCSTV